MTDIVPADQGDPAADPRAFRRCLGQFATGVTVITAAHDGRRAGVTANSFASLSLDPPLVLWSIGRSSRAFQVFATTPRFAVNILAAEQIDVSQRFASAETDKFAGIAWRPGENGAPVLDGVAAQLECTTEAVHQGGDHVLLIGRVTRFARFDRNVLVFAQGRYSLAEDHPDLRSRDDRPASSPAEGPGFGSLLFKAHLCASRGFDARRREAGLTLPQARILYVLSEGGPLSAEMLVQRSDLTAAVIADSVAELTERGEVARLADGRLALTPSGHELRTRMRQEIASYEAAQLEAIAPDELATARAVLARYVERHQGAL